MGKNFGDLKKSQRLAIQEWLYDAYCIVGKTGNRTPTRGQHEEIVEAVYPIIQQNGIDISREEVRRYFGTKISRFRKKFERGDAD